MTDTNKLASGKHLLLVDDDRLVLSTISSGLIHSGYRVTSVESAEEAEIWLASGERPDLAILDVRMPGQGGLHLAHRLHELDHIPFMMLSACSDLPSVERATRCGALGYAVKPLDLPQLIPSIEAALARADELQHLRVARQQLQSALDAERNISVATGIIIMQYRLKRSDAFALLRDTARKQRRKLADMADDIVKACDTLSLDAGSLGRTTLLPNLAPIDFKKNLL